MLSTTVVRTLKKKKKRSDYALSSSSTPRAASSSRLLLLLLFFIFAALILPLDLGSLRAAEALLTCDGATTSGRTKTASAFEASERAFSRLRDEGWFRETGKLAFTHDVEQEEDGSAFGYPGGMIYGEG